MKTLTYLFIVLSFLSCDKCKDVSCGIGDCEKGECICPEPYEGEGCRTHKYASFDGEYVGDIYYVTTYSDGSPATYDTSNAAEVNLNIGHDDFDQVFFGEVNWGLDGEFTLTPLQSHPEKVTGTGSVNGNKLTVNAEYNYVEPLRVITFQFEGTKK